MKAAAYPVSEAYAKRVDRAASINAVHLAVRKIKERSDYLDLGERWNYRDFWKMIEAIVLDKLTWKQYKQLPVGLGPHDKIAAIRKVTKSIKLHQRLDEIELYLLKVQTFRELTKEYRK